jgi:hypothetical protein
MHERDAFRAVFSFGGTLANLSPADAVTSPVPAKTLAPLPPSLGNAPRISALSTAYALRQRAPGTTRHPNSTLLGCDSSIAPPSGY